MADEFPYMPLYWKDWLTGEATTVMTAEQEGAFLNLLLRAWEAKPPCSLPNDPVVLARLSKLGKRWDKVGAFVLAQFEVIDGDRIRNQKQWETRLDLVEHRDRRRNAGRKGNEARWGSQRDRIATDLGSQRPPNGLAKSSPASASAGSDPIGSAGAAGTGPPPPSSNGNGKRPRRRAVEPELELVPWSSQACQLWQDVMKGVPPGGEIGHHLKRLIDQGHPVEEVLERWEKYLRWPDDSRFKNAAKFAQTYGTFDRAPPVRHSGAFRDICPRDPATGELVAPTFSGVADDD